MCSQMNATATNITITALDFDLVSKFPTHRSRRKPTPVITRIGAEEELSRLILQDGRGKPLLKFCHEIGSVLIRNYLASDCTESLRRNVCANLVETLACTEQEAHCLLNLSLELIYVKVHKTYRHANVNLNYLISMATNALCSEAPAA